VSDFGDNSVVTPVAQSHADKGVYYVDLTAAIMRGNSIAVWVNVSGAAGGHWAEIRPEPCLDSGDATTAGNDTITLGGDGHTPSAVDDTYNGASIEIARGKGVGQVRTIVDYNGTSKVATVDRDWETNPDDGTSVYVIKGSGVPLTQVDADSTMRAHANVLQINSDTTAAQNLELLYEGAFITSSAVGSQTTTTVTGTNADLSDDDDTYNNMLLVFTSGVNRGIPRKIEDYDGGDTQFIVTAFPYESSDGDTFILIALIA
jgi:hypothetical protein